MFTGIIETTGTVSEIRRLGAAEGARIVVKVADADFLAGVAVGDSVSVDGACLTAVTVATDTFEVDTAPVTLERTTLGERRSGDTVNLERAMAAGGRFGGHFVTGHVDEVGEILGRRAAGNSILIDVGAPPSFTALLLERGSVAIDGISLTVAYLQESRFTVAIIPHTAEVTSLASKDAGSKVNLEADMIGKYVKRFVDATSVGSSLTMDKLQRHGFA